MFIKRTRRKIRGKVYEYGFLTKSINTAAGPRHKVLYRIGRLDGIAQQDDRQLALQLERMLLGQTTTTGASEFVKEIFSRLKPVNGRPKRAKPTTEELEERLRAMVESEVHLPALVESPSQTELQMQIPEIHFHLQETVPDWLEVSTTVMVYHDAREAGPVHVGHQMWERLGLPGILKSVGLDEKQCQLAEVLTLNRLIEPTSEHATPEWVSRTALGDILGASVDHIDYRDLYGNLDRLHPERENIEKALFDRERNLFNLDESLFLYDLTSTYMEGSCAKNPAAKFGYSRDKRSDCRQHVLGLMLNVDGFAVGHEMFDGNTSDCTTVETAINAFEKRTGIKTGATITMDRGMSDKANIELIKSRGHHYIVAAKQAERMQWLSEFENEDGWTELTKRVSSLNPIELPTGVRIKRFEKGDECFVLCISEGRTAKDKAIREKQEKKLIADLAKLEKRVKDGALKTAKNIHEAIGRLKERYGRVSRYYEINFDETTGRFSANEDQQKKSKAEQVDGSYILRTTRMDLTDEEIWRTYMLLTRVESAFRDLKSPLSMRPIFHQLQHRTEAHIFVCVLAYHLLVSIEHMLRNAGISKSWETVRKELSSHQTVSGVFATKDKRLVEIRRDTLTNPIHREIYTALAISPQIYRTPFRCWRS